MSPSAIRKLPMSASNKVSGSANVRGWAPSLSIRLACRMAWGPKRAPLRLVVPMSNGMPAMQIAAAGSSRSSPRNPNGSEKRGASLVISALLSQRRQMRGHSAFSRQASVPWMTSFHHKSQPDCGPICCRISIAVTLRKPVNRIYFCPQPVPPVDCLPDQLLFRPPSVHSR